MRKIDPWKNEHGEFGGVNRKSHVTSLGFNASSRHSHRLSLFESVFAVSVAVLRQVLDSLLACARLVGRDLPRLPWLIVITTLSSAGLCVSFH